MKVAVPPALAPLPHRAWLIDLDGTLYNVGLVKLALGAQLACGNWKAGRVVQTFLREHKRMSLELSEPVSDPFYLQIERTAEQLGQPHDEVERIVQNWMFRRAVPWMHAFRRRSLLREIVEFRAQGGLTALVSDYPAREKLHAMRASSLFDVVVAIGEPGGPGRLKPWPDGYLLAAKRLGVDPQECLIIGDRADADGAAAQRAGITYRQVG